MRGEVFLDTEGFILAIQDQVVNTSHYLKTILKDPKMRDDKCRKCKESQRQSNAPQQLAPYWPKTIIYYTNTHNMHTIAEQN